MFVPLLFFFTAFGRYCALYSEDEFFVYQFIFGVQMICFLNQLIEDKRIQQLLHDAFVYVLVYGLLCSTNTVTQYFSSFMASTMIITRSVYNRCIFLWWNVGRNMDYDIVVLGMIVACLLRRESWISHWVCVVVGMTSHCFHDASKNSWLNFFLRYEKVNKGETC